MKGTTYRAQTSTFFNLPPPPPPPPPNILRDEGNQYLDRFSNPCQAALGLLLPLSLRNLFGLLHWNIFLFNVLIIFSLLYCKVWASTKKVAYWQSKKIRTKDKCTMPWSRYMKAYFIQVSVNVHTCPSHFFYTKKFKTRY